jgi:hypothetical protein
MKLPSSGGISKNHKYLWHQDIHTFAKCTCDSFFDVYPEDGNLISETYEYVGVTNIPFFVNNFCALVGLT